jgi:hypothetical protein
MARTTATNRRNMYEPSRYLTFNGAITAHLDTGVTNIIPDGTLTISFSCWVYLTPQSAGNINNIRVIIGNRRDSVTTGWVFKIANNPKHTIEFAFYDQIGSSQGWISARRVEFNRWNHIAMTYSGKKCIFYIDGNADPYQVSNVNDHTITEYTEQNLRIGHRQQAGSTYEHFTGHMSDLCIWNKVLTEAEIQSIYQTREIPTENLLARWKMDDTGTTVVDSVNNVSPTLTTGVSFATTALNTSRTSASNRATAFNRTTI